MSRHTSRTNLRGVPHAPNNQIQIVLPAPLSATLPRSHSLRRDTESDRMSVVDKWVPIGRDDFSSTLRRASASATMSTSSSAASYFHHPSPPPPVPQVPKHTAAL
ncbi:hypothetical protein C0995_002572 [Termitomyces sp. Mi166|nr:hypothetical protein C0995_002572 [Termitomyces sp. Mi166\